MDEHRLDTFARRLAGSGPRRSLFGALAGAILTGLALPESALACKHVDRKCDKNKDCCDGAHCPKKKCRCKDAFNKCGNDCVNFDNDEDHCGGCDIACLAGESCVNGTCAEGGCTADLDSCAEGALCTPCPDRPGSVCYLDGNGQVRCSLFILCIACESDADCEDFGFAPGTRCVECAGQCGPGPACAGG